MPEPTHRIPQGYRLPAWRRCGESPTRGEGRRRDSCPRWTYAQTVLRIVSVITAGLICAIPQLAHAIDAAGIPNPRTHGAWITDLADVLSDDAEAELNAYLDDVHDQTGGELAVVVIRSTDGRNPRKFTTQLFNRWGVGSAERDDGVLILVAIKDRKAEIVLGDGLDEGHHLAASDRIMNSRMVPLFKKGRPTEAIRAGVHGCAENILGYGGAETIPEHLEASGPRTVPARNVSRSHPKRQGFIARTRRQWGLWHWLGSILLAIGSFFGGRRIWRFMPRTCKKCNVRRVRLGEAKDDAYLDDGQRDEERIGSVDYDVWACPSCGDVLQLRWGAIISGYGKCPQCGYKTKGSTSTTIRSATYDHGGLVRVNESCAHCSYTNTYTRSTPRRTRSSSSSSGGGSSSSFGGGSSSGSGSSGSW